MPVPEIPEFGYGISNHTEILYYFRNSGPPIFWSYRNVVHVPDTLDTLFWIIANASERFRNSGNCVLITLSKEESACSRNSGQ